MFKCTSLLLRSSTPQWKAPPTFFPIKKEEDKCKYILKKVGIIRELPQIHHDGDGSVEGGRFISSPANYR